MSIVAIEMATYDRTSMDWWWKSHLDEVLALADRLYLRVDPATSGHVLALLHSYLHDRDIEPGRVIVDPQFTHHAHAFQEDAERQALLTWALETGADWAVCFDADEVLEPGGGQALRTLLLSPAADAFRLVRVILSYSSHHRPGYILPRGGFMPWRAFRLDWQARGHTYVADEDGLHCGSVPAPEVGSVTASDLRVIHYHATSCAEYMAERAFYEGTTHVEQWGGIDHLYACGRFANEHDAIPLADELADAPARLARIAAGVGLTA